MNNNVIANSGGGKKELFLLPNPFRSQKKIRIKRQIWFLVQKYLVAPSPKFMNKWRIMWLKMFGAKIGKGCYIGASTYVHLPWKIEMEDFVTIDEMCYLQGEIHFCSYAAIGNNVHIVTEGHNVRSRYFEGTNNPVRIGASCFIGGDAYIARGVTIGDFSVVGAKSVVWHSIDENTIAYGNPCMSKGERIPKEEYEKYRYSV